MGITCMVNNNKLINTNILGVYKLVPFQVNKILSTAKCFTGILLFPKNFSLSSYIIVFLIEKIEINT